MENQMRLTPRSIGYCRAVTKSTKRLVDLCVLDQQSTLLSCIAQKRTGHLQMRSLMQGKNDVRHNHDERTRNPLHPFNSRMYGRAARQGQMNSFRDDGPSARCVEYQNPQEPGYRTCKKYTIDPSYLHNHKHGGSEET